LQFEYFDRSRKGAAFKDWASRINLPTAMHSVDADAILEYAFNDQHD